MNIAALYNHLSRDHHPRAGFNKLSRVTQSYYITAQLTACRENSKAKASMDPVEYLASGGEEGEEGEEEKGRRRRGGGEGEEEGEGGRRRGTKDGWWTVTTTLP